MTREDLHRLDFEVNQIREQYINFEIQREVAERELKVLGLTNDQILYALGEVNVDGC